MKSQYINKKHRYEKLRKMDPPQFQGGKSEDAHEVLTTCLECLEIVEPSHMGFDMLNSTFLA